MGKDFCNPSCTSPRQSALVIGSGPNGLSAAVALAQAGYAVLVREAQPEIGGACRSLPLTLPGFVHDFGSAVYPMGPGSPFLRTLPLDEHGLHWLHHPTPLTHPLDDGTAVTLERDPMEAREALGRDGDAWWKLVGPLAEQWNEWSSDLFAPILHWPKHPLRMARFGAMAALPAHLLAATAFRTERARALFAGLAAHSFLSLRQPFSSAVALVLGAAAHAVGWPIPRGGSSSITQALSSLLTAHGGSIQTNSPVESLDEIPPETLVFFDTAPEALLRIAGKRLPKNYAKKIHRFRHGSSAFKVDYALREPIPWRAEACKHAGTVHLGGSLDEIAHSEHDVVHGRIPSSPFVLLAQPTLADPTRAPMGQHVAWAYCHLPYGCEKDATELIEKQIERFAPGFREVVIGRSISPPSRLQSLDSNLVNGDISGGAMNGKQLLFRPTLSAYRTPDPLLWLCSSSTPPGGGVHGMCGWNAVQAALRSLPK